MSRLAFVVYIYVAEIGNALICRFSGHALRIVPTGTSYLVGVVLSFMFSAAGLLRGE